MISVVIPIFNEEKLIESLFSKVVETLKKLDTDYELIFVNDGSEDRSLDILLQIQQHHPGCKIIALSRNFGHQAAYTAGMDHAKGEFIILMDGDLQDPPELIEALYQKARKEEFDVVFAKRISREEGLIRKVLMRLFHYIFNKTSSISAPMNVGNFCCMNRKALNSLMALKEKNRYLPGLRFFIGFKQGYIEYSREARAEGETKMSIAQLTKLALDAIFSFSNFPLKFCLYIGVLGIVISVSAGSFSLISKFLGLATPGWSSILLSIYFFGSVQLIFLGVVGEYVFRIYTETQNRPLYFIDKIYE